MVQKGQTDIRALIVIPVVVVITAIILLGIADTTCKTMPENCGYIKGIVYTLIGAMVIGAVGFLKFGFFRGGRII